MPTPTRPVHSEESQSLQNWFHELKEHDLQDTRGLLEGLAAVLLILASRLPAAAPGVLVLPEL